MASVRFKNAIATQLAKFTGGDVATIQRAIDRPKIKGHDTFAIPMARLFPSGGRVVLESKKKEKKQQNDKGTNPNPSSLSREGSEAFLQEKKKQQDILDRLVREFLNFTVDERRLTRETIQDVIAAETAKRQKLQEATKAKENNDTIDTVVYPYSLGYGLDGTVGQGQVVAIDYSSPNIAKPFHGGHLRGTILGNFATRLLRGFGYKVIGINYLGDWGKQYGLMAVGFDRYGDRMRLQQDPIQHLFDVYVKINKDIAEDPALDKKANAYFKQMEDGDRAVLDLWQEFRTLSIKFYKEMYKRLGIEFDVYSGESESAQWVPQAYQLLRDKALLVEQEDGAWVVDLTEHGLGVCTLRRADGTTLYLTRDVAACLQRAEQFKFDRHLYMIGDDQNLHMKRLFKIMELAMGQGKDVQGGTTKAATQAQGIVERPVHWSLGLRHISFGKVQGMSTRRGNAVFLEDILDTARDTMLEKMRVNESKFEAVKGSILDAESADKGLKASKEEEDERVLSVADKLGISAVVIQDFQARSSKGYEFSWKRMTESTGNTGIYLQYAHARLCGIEEKSGTRLNMEANADLLTEPEAFELANVISMYPEVTRTTLETMEPSMIVNYLFHLSHAISGANQVLQVKSVAEAGDRDLAEARLLLLWAARTTLGNGMQILGLEPLERM
ncbi:Arginyl-tRNA synthetase [Podila epigama]|nr:Arginyl-tRNA synthetase [Podila epigama]